MSIENRLVALERSAARWRVAAVVLGCGLLVVLSGGADKGPVQDNVFARHLVIVNDKNQICGTFTGEADGGHIDLHAAGGNPKNSPTLVLNATAEAAHIAALSGSGTSAQLGFMPGKGAVIEAIGDETGRHAGMYASPNDGPSVSVFSTKKTTATIAAPADGSGAFIDVSTAAGSVWHEPHATK